MHVLSFFRSTLASPRRRLNGALVILTVIFGVVTMHSMSGSPSSHHAPHADPAVVAQGATPVGGIALPAAPDSHAAAEAAGAEEDCADGCCGHDAAMAMCLMILVALLALVVPSRRLLWRALLAWSAPVVRVVVDVRAIATPSLHELCISRT